jgi:hypothetical protein
MTKPLAAQFEIGDALCLHRCAADYSAPRANMGTGEAINYFLSYMESSCGWVLNKSLQNQPVVETRKPVIVVAHRHHVGRCLVLLNDRGLDCLLPSWEYLAYDTECEAQWRARSPQINICSDFVSMCAWMCS